MDYSGTDNPPPPQVAERDRYVASYPPEELDTEFKRKYPPDPFGEEMGPNARVWKVYKDEATPHDKSLLDGWNKTLDILLIFAGLFSAVATAFVIESYKLLQPDYEEYIANALFAALSNRSRSGSDAFEHAVNLHNPSDFLPLGSSRWLNGLWFTSLVLSLVVAFLCILLKQWLEEYSSRTSAPFSSARQWARRRTFYYSGLMGWGVSTLIAVLPLLLHAALFLFLLGLSVLLFSLDVASASWIFAGTIGLFCFYLAATLLPFFRADCPSSTPMIRTIRKPIRTASLRVLYAISSIVMSRRVTPPQWYRDSEAPSTSVRFLTKGAHWCAWTYYHFLVFTSELVRRVIPIKMREYMTATYWRLVQQFQHSQSRNIMTQVSDQRLSPVQRAQCDANALRWIITSRPSADVLLAGFHALGAMPPWAPAVNLLRTADGLEELFRKSMKVAYSSPISFGDPAAADIARDLRSGLSLFGPAIADLCIRGAAPRNLYTRLVHSPHYDFPFMFDMIGIAWRGHDQHRLLQQLAMCSLPTVRQPSPHFLASTALQLLYSDTTPLSVWIQLCRLLPLWDIPLLDFIEMAKSLLRHRRYNVCPLQDLHTGKRCRIQCSFELLSEIINCRQLLGLSDADVHAGLDIILIYGERCPEIAIEVWSPIGQSHLLALLQPDVLLAHNTTLLRRTIDDLALNLTRMAHCYRRPRGLPLWTDQWTHAFTSILAATIQFNHQGVSEGISIRIPWAIAIMFNTDSPTAHASILPSDDFSRLPLTLLDGGIQSPWHMLLSLPQRRSTALMFDRLEDLLAASLCTAARRGLDVRTRLATFTDRAHITKRFARVQRYSDRSKPVWTDLVTIVRHCSEIEPDWLSGVLNPVLDTGSSHDPPTLRSAVQYVVQEARRLGPCMKCPGVAAQGYRLGWRSLSERVSAGIPRYRNETFREDGAIFAAGLAERNFDEAI